MRFSTIILLTLFLIFAFKSQAQNKFGVGVSTAIFPHWNPGMPLTPYLFYQHRNHEFLAGVDMYGGQLGFASILGIEAEYRYRFYRLNNNLDLFANIHFQYVRFATGPAQNVPFNYSEFVAPGLNYSMIRMRTLNNTWGAGLQYSFWKVCGLHLSWGIGYHFYRNTITDGVSPSYVNDDLLGSQVVLGYVGKIGFSVRLVEK